MDLSLEIRNMIYEYSLVRGTIFIPPVVEDIFAGSDYLIYGNDDERSSRYHEGHVYLYYKEREKYGYSESLITIGLLQGVSKAVQTEATAVFYGVKNFSSCQ